MDPSLESIENNEPVAPLDELTPEELKQAAGGQDGTAHAKPR